MYWLDRIDFLVPLTYSLYKGIHVSGPVDLSAYMGQISQDGYFPKHCNFFATLTAVFKHFLYWFDCFNYFYGSITCATVGKTKFLTRHLRIGT